MQELEIKEGESSIQRLTLELFIAGSDRIVRIDVVALRLSLGNIRIY